MFVDILDLNTKLISSVMHCSLVHFFFTGINTVYYPPTPPLLLFLFLFVFLSILAPEIPNLSCYRPFQKM